jgi:hypothetical protein
MNLILKNKNKKVIWDDDYNNYIDAIDNINIGVWYLSGFWQRTDYFEDYREDIINAFPLKPNISNTEKEIVEKLEKGEYIAIHIRGGDFINSRFNLCGIDYYEKAIQEINRERFPLVVFTDDQKYATKLLEKYNIAYFISHGVYNSIVDMYMMSRAKKLIISNSTFAFWGAYLSTIDGQEVISPKYATWDGSKYSFFTQRNFWKVIDNSNEEMQNKHIMKKNIKIIKRKEKIL